MTWHGDGTKCGKKWHFRGQKWAKKGVARGMAKLHRKIRLLECARGGVFGVARGGAEIAVFGDFGDGGKWWWSWPSTRSGQRELDSVKTDLIAVERNLVSGNKIQQEQKQIKSTNKKH